MLNLVFMGTPEFAVPSLEALCQAGYPILAVVTGADKPRGRGQRLSPTPVKQSALRHTIPVLEPASVKDPAFAQQLLRLRPDLAVVVAFRILPPPVFTVPRLGTFNLHASLLPRYRGAAPINWAIMNGETETGVTTFFLEQVVDTGAMLLQARVSIEPEDDAGTLHDRLAGVGARIVLDTVRMIERGEAKPQPQDNGEATPAPKIFKEQCRILWNRPAEQLQNFVRGLAPHPAAWTMHGDHLLKVYRTRSVKGGQSGIPGVVTVTDTSLMVAAQDGHVEILELQQEGRRRMTAMEFLRGYSLTSGDHWS
jgi:methionyl-tRNA formyltransferase